MTKLGCQRYACRKMAVEVVDVWNLCETHAKQYRIRFGEALKAQQLKRTKSESHKS